MVVVPDRHDPICARIDRRDRYVHGHCDGTNSILVVSFAREEFAAHGDAVRAAVAAGYARLRPVMMTALAMIIGMLPMSMSNTQNAPLGRAVIGGLLVATFCHVDVCPLCLRLVAPEAIDRRRGTMKRRKLMILGAPVVVIGMLLLYGIMRRDQALSELTRVSKEQAALPVQIITPTRGPSERPLILPGTVRAWYEAPIFAQVSGYVHSWNVDYGAPVKAGQLLAMIDTPSLDAQYATVKANLHVAEANYRLAVSTAERWQALAGTVAVSKQEVDVQVAGAAARKAELEAATQEVARYAALRIIQARGSAI